MLPAKRKCRGFESSVMDGLERNQRKVLFSAFEYDLFALTYVDQFNRFVFGKSGCKYREKKLNRTIVGMAQDFVGSNNINLFQYSGLTGTRLKGGRDYLVKDSLTCLHPVSRFIFPKDDDVLLDYQREVNKSVEPSWYAPIIPMVLVNGAGGLETLWTLTPKFDPKDIIANIKNLLEDKPMEPMNPSYRGFNGTTEKSTKDDGGCVYTFGGKIEEIDQASLRITELPLGCWTKDYLEFLVSNVESTVKDGGDKVKERFIKQIKNLCRPEVVEFVVYMDPEKLQSAKEEGLMEKFNLTTSLPTTNMTLLDPCGVRKEYASAEEILEEFYHVRLDLYEKRKNYYISYLHNEWVKLHNQGEFMHSVLCGKFLLRNREGIVEDLKQLGFDPLPQEGRKLVDRGDKYYDADYDYLLSMPMRIFTDSMVDKFRHKEQLIKEAHSKLSQESPKSLWLKDLKHLLKALPHIGCAQHIFFAKCGKPLQICPNFEL